MDGATESEECFAAHNLKLANGKDTLPITKDLTESTEWVNTTLQLPSGLTCNHCVLRWHYNVGKEILHTKNNCESELTFIIKINYRKLLGCL